MIGHKCKFGIGNVDGSMEKIQDTQPEKGSQLRYPDAMQRDDWVEDCSPTYTLSCHQNKNIRLISNLGIVTL